MKRMMIVTAISALLCAPMADADTAVYREGELYLPQGMVIQDGGDQYYRHIRFKAQSDGSLKLQAAEPRNLATVEELELGVFYSDPISVELKVTGYLQLACLDLEPVAVHRTGNTFHVLIAETPFDPQYICPQGTSSFEINIDLDASSLAAGYYLVFVNGMEIDFMLEYEF